MVIERSAVHAERGGDFEGIRRAELNLPAELTSVRRARGFVTETLLIWECEDPGEIVVLLTSEVVTNATRHAAESVQVAVELEPEQSVVVVETIDDHPGIPVLRPSAPQEESGRGLWLVEQLARRWGVRFMTGGRKAVWFEVGLALPGRFGGKADPAPRPVG